MTRTLFLRILSSLGVAALLSSFVIAEPPETGPTLSTTSSAYRVSHHYAAGLEYLLLEPNEVEPDAELPMLVYIHGRSSVPTPPDGPLFGVETPVRIIMPRAPDRSGYGYSWMPVSAAHGERPELVGPLVARASMIADAMGEWRRRHPTRGRPIVVGFSQGGMLAMEIASAHPSSISQAIALAGWIPPSRMPTGPRDPYTTVAPIHALHGGADPILGAARTQATIERLIELGYPADIEVFEGVAHEVSPAMSERARGLILDALEALPEDGRTAGQS